MKNYLKLRRRSKDPPIVIYVEDENGDPILDSDKVAVMRFRSDGREVVIGVDSANSYKFMRYEVLEKNPEEFGKLKRVVDNKLSSLEGEVQ